jgi:predicted AlkP superfamily pyrophosphatase or phosphodiesterase
MKLLLLSAVLLLTARALGAQAEAPSRNRDLPTSTSIVRRALSVPPAGGRPDLIVLIVVDQLRPDYYDRFRSQMTGGLKRLYEDGAVFTNAFHDHANTETAPGHSVMLSGRFPAHTGIVLNTQGAPDPQTPLIGGGGLSASPFRFRGSTLIDWIRTRDPESRALSVSRKDRGAIFPLGRAHQSAFWYASDGRFTTSTYYAQTLPAWVDSFNERRAPARAAGTSWAPLLPASAYAERDDAPAELLGIGPITFPHLLPTDTLVAEAALTEFPVMDSLTVQLALAGVEAMHLGRSGSTDLLSVSLSTLDAVGHRYGPDSKEVHDQVLRVDRYLGTLFDSLFTLVDSTKVVIALTADHGMAPWPATSPDAHKPGFVPWIDLRPLLSRTRASLVARGVDSTVIRLDEWALLLDRNALAASKMDADSLVHAFAVAARRVKGVARADRLRDLASSDTVNDPIARRWLHAIPPDSPIELVITLNQYSQWAPGTYDKHGSPYDYDAHVPLVIYGPMIEAGRHSEMVRVVDLAPTLAFIAGVPPTEMLDGSVLRQALRNPAPVH